MSSQPKVKTFKIKSFPDFFKYTLGDKNLEIYHWNFFRGSRIRVVRLDEIGHRYEILHSPQYRANFFGLFFAISVLMLLPFLFTPFLSSFFDFLLPVAILFFVLTFLSKMRVVVLAARPEVLVFPCSKSKLQETEIFVKEIIEQSKDYLIWKYGQADEDLPVEKQIQNYKWLRDIEVIDDETYLSFKERLKALLEKKKPNG